MGGVFAAGGASHLSQPAAVVEHFELEQDARQLVVAADDAASLGSLQDHRVLLERLHRLLDPPVQLARPRDLTCTITTIINGRNGSC